MDKNAIKKYAVWARRELIERVSQRAMIYGITAKDAGDPTAESVNGHLLSQAEKRQRQALIRNIKEKGYEQVMEEVAYTWFNRFAALRFMEVNGYLPSHIRVFTNDAGEFKPQILAEAIHLELDGLDMNKVYELESANKSEELFKYLLIVQCNALNSILPGMFQRIDDYTELLLPDYLLREGNVIEQMVTIIPEEDWTDQVQIIGWLYQFYIAEPKDTLINARKQYNDNEIGTVTQLFTPDWIVHYMVENSLGRLWLEGHPNDALKSEWKYYLDEAEQEPDVQAQLAAIRKEYAALKPEEIRVIDPCMGSGHILCVLFDVLVRIYEDYGYTAREAAVKIVENNLWGLDIDERAAQLSYFAVMMKARQYDRRFFARNVQPHVHAVQETNRLQEDYAHARGDFALSRENQETLDYLMHAFVDAKEYGSILRLEQRNYAGLKEALETNENEKRSLVTLSIWYAAVFPSISALVEQAIVMSQTYDVVCTNPPYMNSTYMPDKLRVFVQDNYPDHKTDLFAAFVARITELCNKRGQIGLLTPYVWMFILSYEKMRKQLLESATITSMVQLEYNAFEGATVPVCSFTLRNNRTNETGEYIRLNNFKGVENQRPKTLEAISDRKCGYRFTASSLSYMQIPGAPIAYWLNSASVDLYGRGELMSEYVDLKQGLITGDNNRFLRFWQECDSNSIHTGDNEKKKWFFYHKGGEYRKWYGNCNLVVNWENDGDEIINFRDEKGKQKSRPQNVRFYLREGFTWTALTIADFNVRYMPEGCIFDAKGSSGFVKAHGSLKYFIALCNSKVSMEFLSFLAPTMDYNAGAIGKIPVIYDRSIIPEVEQLVDECVFISKEDWDSFEESWDYKGSPLIRPVRLISDAFAQWENECNIRFTRLKKNEERLNEIFIQLYGLTGEITPNVDDAFVTVRKADLHREIVGLISYAVGCMFGRYALGNPGLAYAGGKWEDSQYSAFLPDRDAILPICDDEYFEDDIVGRFIEFIKVAYGSDTLEENLQFIASILGGKGSSREVLRAYFIDKFYEDHCSIYSVSGSGKRPIYWLFDSGKKNGFKCLIYMHRYQPDTIARIRTDYVHEQQSRYRTAIADLEQRINGASTSERVKLSKQLATLQAQAEEVRVYEEKIHHLADQMIKIDLDDGVKHNYEIFKDVLAKVR